MRWPILLAAVLALGASARSDPPPSAALSPQAFFGYEMGAGERLPTWDETIKYFQAIAQASPRVRVDEVGKTTLGRPYVIVTISAADTPRDLDTARHAQRRLADPRQTPVEEAAALARRHKAVVVVAGGVHSTETGSAQALNELIWRLATDDSPETQHLLANLIVLVVPSQNPDGLQMVAEWHRRNAGTPYEDAPLPELYHPYAGHDNNRDAFMQALVETRHLSRVLYHDWLPEVFLDLHQMGPSRARVFVPPYRDPVNPNIDPLVWSEANLLGQTMAARLQAAGKTGVLWGETYTGYWQGANSSTPWWHNIIGVLSEVASARPTRELVQDTARAASGSLSRSTDLPPGSAHLSAPPDVQFRMTYPEPWLGGRWTPRDVVEHHLLAALGLLEGVANNRVLIKQNFHAMHRRTIERFAAGRPWAYVVPGGQRDRGAADRLLEALAAGGAEIEEPVSASGGLAPGDAVVRLAQPFGRWIKDVLEPQIYPEPRRLSDRPYDVTAWTLGLQMGVAVHVLDEPVPVMLEPRRPAARIGRVHGAGEVLVVPPATNAAATLVNELWTAGAAIDWADVPMVIDEVQVPAGSALASGLPGPAMAAAVQRSGLQLVAVARAGGADLVPSQRPRVAILEPWGGAMDAGWTRLVLEQHGFTFTRLRPGDVARAADATALDAIVIPDMPVMHLLRGQHGAAARPEHRGGLGPSGVAALKRFVHEGGVLVTLGNATEFAIEYLDVPVTVASRADDPNVTFVPGALLRASVEPASPVASGLPGEIVVMHVFNNAYAAGRGGERVQPVVRYASSPLVASGYATGEAPLEGHLAAFDAPLGRGRVIGLGFRVQHRAQTWGTFRLLFNALFLAGRRAAAPAATAIDN